MISYVITSMLFLCSVLKMLEYLGMVRYNWASMRENLSSVDCEQQRCRPDQHLCHSLIGKYHASKLATSKFINFPANLCN